MKNFETNIAVPVFCLILLILSSGMVADIQAQTSSNQEGNARIYKFSARTGALADATVADPNDISSMNINPASLSFVHNLEVVQLNISQNWDNNLMLENITFPALRYGNHTFGTQFSIHHDRGFESLNLLGNPTQLSPKINMYQLDIGYAYSFKEKVSIGMMNNISYAYNSLVQMWTYNPTFGILYMPSESMSYAFAFRGLGNTPSYQVHNPSMTTFEKQNLRESLEFGVSLRLPVYSDQTAASIALSNEKLFGIEGSWYKMGLEITKIPYLALRSGVMYQSDQELFAPRFGLGILTDIVELDYTVSHSKNLYERYHQLGLTIHL